MTAQPLDAADAGVIMTALFYFHFDSGQSKLSVAEVDQLYRKVCDIVSALDHPLTRKV
jgi:hypothetical protein